MASDMNMNIRVSKEQYEQMKKNATTNGFESLSAFVKYVSLNATVQASVRAPGTKNTQN